MTEAKEDPPAGLEEAGLAHAARTLGSRLCGLQHDMPAPRRSQHAEKAVARCGIPPASQVSPAASCCLIFFWFSQSPSSVTAAYTPMPTTSPLSLPTTWLHLESVLSPDFKVGLQVEVKGSYSVTPAMQTLDLSLMSAMPTISKKKKNNNNP